MKDKKKGITLQEGLNAVVIIGLIGLFLGFFALFNDKFVDVAPVLSGSITNESLTVTNTSLTYFASAYECNAGSFSVSSCYNATGGELIATGNYTVSSTAGTIIGTATMDEDLNGAGWNCSYTFVYTGTVCNISESMNTEFENQTDILGLVLLAIFFGIAITALLASFMVRFFGSRRI